MVNLEFHTVIKFLGVLRSWDPDMPFQQVQTLLLVSMYPGITLSELADRLEIAQSSASRNVAALGKVHRLQKEGLDFVEAIEDPSERRRKICFLTERGHREVLGLMRMLYPDFNFDAGPTAKERIDNVMSSLRKRR